MQQALELLKHLTETVPPRAPAKHNITLHDGDTLMVSLALDVWAPVLLDDEADYQKSAETLTAEVVAILKTHPEETVRQALRRALATGENNTSKGQGQD